jgi:deoxyribodipyrimidine photo-lyase
MDAYMLILSMTTVSIFWFRRDLRLEDNHGLFQALQSGLPVVPIFVFDQSILAKLSNKEDRRVSFIHHSLMQIQEELVALGSSLEVYHGLPDDVFQQLFSKYKIKHIFTNHDYESYAQIRDANIKIVAETNNANFTTCKDQVIFEKSEVVKDDGLPYTVFTPYSRKWKLLLQGTGIAHYDTTPLLGNFFKQSPFSIPQLSDIGFESTNIAYPSSVVRKDIIKEYTENRNFPSKQGTTRLGVHLRFGTISVRALAKEGAALCETYLNELIWRDFYMMILWHFPNVGKGKAFKPAYENIQWRNDESEFERWCAGKTGYPIVDAGMRELNTTGFMHNRVRMIVASFLCKHLLIDWRWGEAYFAEKLLDFDLAANNGGWQWAAGSGCDAAPYFRIFNPRLQTEKFDKSLAYIKYWVPDSQEFNYPSPIVDHDFARKRCLEVYKKALSEQN